MKVLIFACAALFLAVVARADDKCTMIERFKIHNQWERAFGYGEDRITFGVNIFNRLFKDHPDARKLFPNVNGDNVYSSEFKAHVERVLSSLDLAIHLLDSDDILAAQLAHLKAQHDSRHIDAKYVSAFKEALLEELPDHLGVNVDWDAWNHCFDFLAKGIFG